MDDPESIACARKWGSAGDKLWHPTAQFTQAARAGTRVSSCPEPTAVASGAVWLAEHTARAWAGVSDFKVLSRDKPRPRSAGR